MDGVTGHVVDHYDDFPTALRDTADLDPAACRRHVEQHFNPSTMAAGYERAYRTVVERDQPHPVSGNVASMRPRGPSRPAPSRRPRLAPPSRTRASTGGPYQPWPGR